MKTVKTPIQEYLQDVMNRKSSLSLDMWAHMYVQANWQRFEYCITNKLPIYIVAPTQSGKTKVKLWLSHMALEKGLVDVVIISTTNLTQAQEQLFDRTTEFFQPHRGYEVKELSQNAIMKEGNIFVLMTNQNRTKRIDVIANEAYEYRKSHNLSDLRILTLIDEGEEQVAELESNQCERALTNLLLDSRYDITYGKISATLFSVMLTHGKYSYNHGNLRSEQIFEFPEHPYYHGIRQPGFLKQVLEAEEHYSGGYNRKATLSNTRNIQICLEHTERLIRNQRKLGHDKQTRNLPQIGIICLDARRNGHTRIAEMFEEGFQNIYKRSVEIWDGQDSESLTGTNEIVIIVHNGDTREFSIQEKLTIVARKWGRKGKPPRAILIVAKKMAGKSITVEADGSCDPTQVTFGYYCNFGAYYGPMSENITVFIQSVRSTGIRPRIKTHEFWSTTDVADESQRYYAQQDAFIQHVRNVGEVTKDFALDWLMKRPVAKKHHQDEIAPPKPTSGQRRSRGIPILASERGNYTQADRLLPMTRVQYKTLGTDKKKLLAFLQKELNISTQDPNELSVRDVRSYDSAQYARQACQGIYRTQGHVMNLHWFLSDKKYYLYVYQDMPKPYVRYKINTLKNDMPVFSDSIFEPGPKPIHIVPAS